MRNLLRFIIQYQFFLLFLLLETISISLIIRHNQYPHVEYINFLQQWQASVNKKLNQISQYIRLREINEQLTIENEKLKNQLVYYTSQTKFQNQQNILVPYEYIIARVIDNSVNKPYNYIMLDRGKADGVEPQMAVIAPDGLVGMIEAVSDHYAIVIPLLNKKFKVSAKFKKSHYFGSFEWSGTHYLKGYLNDIPLHVSFNKGDTIVTSGFSKIFPEGILIGTVDDFSASTGTFYQITVKLSTDFKRLHYVYIIKDFTRKEKQELENQLNP